MSEIFNLLVTADDEAWDWAGEFFLARERFLEFTEESLRDRFDGLDPKAKLSLLNAPALFAYETPVDKPARLGKILEISEKGHELRIRYEIDELVDSVSQQVIQTRARHLGIYKSEMNRTHWAVKDGDLMRALGAPMALAKETRRKDGSSDGRPKIFVVHGRDEGAKNKVALFLSRIGCDPVVLHERPSRGRTLITKFEEESAEVRFAVVLMTPDDVGGLDAGAVSPRARQNVVFELGYLAGKLGLNNICALLSDRVEPPSDIEGLVYVSFGQGDDWKRLLARELDAAGVRIDHRNLLNA